MPESLVNTLQSCQTLRDVFHALHTHWTQQSGDQIHEYQIEVERLQTKLEHIRAQNNVIALSMEESKSNSEQLSLLIGQYLFIQVLVQCALRLYDECYDSYNIQIIISPHLRRVLATLPKTTGLLLVL